MYTLYSTNHEAFELELLSIDMAVNVKKSSTMRTMYGIKCASININNQDLP